MHYSMATFHINIQSITYYKITSTAQRHNKVFNLTKYNLYINSIKHKNKQAN